MMICIVIASFRHTNSSFAALAGPIGVHKSKRGGYCNQFKIKLMSPLFFPVEYKMKKKG